jgi:hypothetical protein
MLCAPDSHFFELCLPRYGSTVLLEKQVRSKLLMITLDEAGPAVDLRNVSPRMGTKLTGAELNAARHCGEQTANSVRLPVMDEG